MTRIVSLFIGLLFALVISLPIVSAQETSAAKIVNGGIINSKATSLPKPEYPETARAAGIGGVIGVDVIINEAGMVISAVADANDQREQKAQDGSRLQVPADSALREAAENAARQATFAPTILSGVPVKVKGKIIYNFVSDKTNEVRAVGNVKFDVLNCQAISLPAPGYPPAARAVRAEGSVAIRVTIGEDGNVIAATAIDGHPLLRSAAETAAREAKFTPTIVNGQATMVEGVLTYNFVGPKKSDQ